MVTDHEWPEVGGGHGPRGFRVRTSVRAGEMIVAVVGELDFATAPLLDEVLSRDGAVATGRVVVDVSDLTFMGAAGLNVLVGAHHRLLGECREGLVVRGAAGMLRRIADLAELSFLLEDTESAGAAGAVSCQGSRGATLRWGAGRLGCRSRICSWLISPWGVRRTSVRCVPFLLAWMMFWTATNTT